MQNQPPHSGTYELPYYEFSGLFTIERERHHPVFQLADEGDHFIDEDTKNALRQINNTYMFPTIHHGGREGYRYVVDDDREGSERCRWTYCEDLNAIEWDRSKAVFQFEHWLNYISDLLRYRGYKLNGRMIYRGRDIKDLGIVIAENGLVQVHTIQELSWMREELKQLIHSGVQLKYNDSYKMPM